MADQGAINRLRGNIGDTEPAPDQAYDDAELGAFLDTAVGVEPRARVAALLPLWAEAAGRVDYTAGASSEKSAQAFAMLERLLQQAQAEVAALDVLDAQGGAQRLSLARASIAIPATFVF